MEPLAGKIVHSGYCKFMRVKDNLEGGGGGLRRIQVNCEVIGAMIPETLGQNLRSGNTYKTHAITTKSASTFGESPHSLPNPFLTRHLDKNFAPLLMPAPTSMTLMLSSAG